MQGGVCPWSESISACLSCCSCKPACRWACPPCRKILCWPVSRRSNASGISVGRAWLTPIRRARIRQSNCSPSRKCDGSSRRLGNALGDALQKGAPPTPQGKVLGAEGPKLIHAAAHAPHGAVYLQCRRRPQRAGHFRRRDRQHRRRDRRDQSVARKHRTHFVANCRSAGEAGWHKLPLPPGMPLVQWGFRGKYLMLGIGAGSADGIVSRGKGQPPAWLTKIKERLPVERVSTVHYLNVKTVVAVAEPLMGGPGTTAIVAALGSETLNTSPTSPAWTAQGTSANLGCKSRASPVVCSAPSARNR